MKKKNWFFKIPESILIVLNNFSKIKEISEPLTVFIKQQFELSTERNCLSCRKLSNLYKEKTGKNVSRTTINKIIKEKLGYRFLKSNPKDNNVNDYDHILMSFTFIKIIVRCVNLGFNVLFCDETGLSNKNNNFYSWRKKMKIYIIIMTIWKEKI